MKPAFVLLAVVAACSAQLGAEDDGSWKPQLDGSALGNGDLLWLGPDGEDGQYRPEIHERSRRSLGLINANALPVPADTLEVALAKNAQLIQQNTEGTRNILGGGIPLSLPADTLEVAIGKQAHAIAHENQKAITSGLPIATPIATRIATPWAAAPLAATWAGAPIAASWAGAPIAARIAAPWATPLGLTTVW